MSKSRKVLAALLALVIAVGVFSMSAFATGNVSYAENEVDADGKPYTQDWGLSDPTPVEGKANTYIVSIVLTTNYKVGPIQFQIAGENGDVKVVSATVNADGYYPATASVNKTTGLVLLTPNTDDVLQGKMLDKAVIASVTYTSGSNDAPGIVKDVRSASNMDGTLVAARLTGEHLNNSDFVVGQTATFSSAGQVAPPVAANAELEAIADGVVVDTTKTFGGAYAGAIYGIPADDGGKTVISSADYYVEFLAASNGGSLEITKSIYSGRKPAWGTGTEVTLKNADGTTAGKYVIVIFGDVDGSGAVDTNDVKDALAQVKSATLPEVKMLAANCDIKLRGKDDVVAKALYDVSTNDVSAILGQSKSYSDFDYAAMSAMHSKDVYVGNYYK